MAVVDFQVPTPAETSERRIATAIRGHLLKKCGYTEHAAATALARHVGDIELLAAACSVPISQSFDVPDEYADCVKSIGRQAAEAANKVMVAQGMNLIVARIRGVEFDPAVSDEYPPAGLVWPEPKA